MSAPAHLVVTVIDGDIERALREYKKARQRAVLHSLLKRSSDFWYARSPGQKRRSKQRLARARARKLAAKRATYDRQQELAGR